MHQLYAIEKPVPSLFNTKKRFAKIFLFFILVSGGHSPTGLARPISGDFTARISDDPEMWNMSSEATKAILRRFHDQYRTTVPSATDSTSWSGEKNVSISVFLAGSEKERGSALLEILKENLWSRDSLRLVPVEINKDGVKIVVFVAADYISIKTISGKLWPGMSFDSATMVARTLGLSLPPSTFFVDAVHEASDRKLPRMPLANAWPKGTGVDGAEIKHASLLQQTVFPVNPIYFSTSWASHPARLISGHKKDLLSQDAATEHARSGIYGWHGLGKKAFQNLNEEHGIFYRDYSQGARLVAPFAVLFSDDGKNPKILSFRELRNSRGRFILENGKPNNRVPEESS